jgi:transposase
LRRDQPPQSSAVMKLEVLFHQLLGLGAEWEVTGLTLRQEDGIVEIRVRETGNLWASTRCAVDQAPLRGYDHAEERRWRHLNLFQYRCEIVCALPRGRCATCGKVTTIQAPWEGLTKGFTLAFEAMCLLLARDLPVAALARFVGETDQRLWRMLTRHVDKARETKDMSQVEHVCCDEVSIRRGHVYATVFADAQRRDVLLVTPQRDDATWFRFRDALAAHGGDIAKLQTATMDLSGAYQSGARHYAPQATIVFDRFHVVQLANKALDEVRRREAGRESRDGPTLKRQRFLLLKNPENLTAAARAQIEQLQTSFEATGKAYRAKLALQQIYEIADPARARLRLDAWLRWTDKLAEGDPLLRSLRRLRKTIAAHREGLLAYFTHRFTNGYREGLMSVFSATKRKARGYRNIRYLATMLYLVGSHLKLPSQSLAGGRLGRLVVA